MLLCTLLFLAMWGAKLALIDRFGSDLPYWDQWSKEGDSVYPAWLERGSVWRAVFTPHNEHRIVPTLALNLALVVVSGQWDARVQCILSSALHAAILAGIFWWTLRRLPLQWAFAAGAGLALLGIAPIAWENLVGGFQSQFYFLIGFSLLAIVGLLQNPPLSRWWWGGLAAGAMALISMGSGLLGAAPIVGVSALRLLERSVPRRNALLTICAGLGLAGLGAWLHTRVPGHAALQAGSLGVFLGYVANCLAWPWVNQPWLGVILWSPWLILAGKRFVALARGNTPRNHDAPGSDVVLGVGAWVLAQIAAVSYSRGGSGELPASRYGDVFALGVIVSFVALALLTRDSRRWSPFAIAWASVAGLCVLVAARQTWSTPLQLKQADQRSFEQAVQHFVFTDDYATFARQPLPFPNPDWLARILRSPGIRSILPSSVRLPVRIPGLDPETRSTGPSLPARATRTMSAPDEWRSPPLSPGRGWWKIETAGHLGADGASLQLVSVKTGRVLGTIAPSKFAGDSWRAAYVRAPREEARLVARTDGAGHWFSFSEPIVMSSVSYHAWRLCQHGQLILGGTLFVAFGLMAWELRRRRGPAEPAPDNSLSANRGFAETHPLRMKFFTFTAVLAAALFSAVVSVPFLPAAKLQPDYFMLELRASSTTNGALQVYYDDGAGFRETLSARTTLKAAVEPEVYRLPFPPGSYRAFRLDPLDREGAITLASARIVASSGRAIREIALKDFKPEQQVQSARMENGSLQIVTKSGSDDPQLSIAFSPTLSVRPAWTDLARNALPFFAPILVGLVALLVLLDRAPGVRTIIAERARRLTARPGRAVWIIAAIGVVASTYPVVFLGKSHVSPNLGTTLLYDTYPTLPGYRSSELVDVKGSDIGAIMWSHIPFSMVQHRALAQGELPLWNRYNSMGTPMLAQGQSMFGDPLHFFVIAFNGAAWAWDIKYLVAKWLFAAGLGLLVLAILAPRGSPPAPEAGSGRSALPAAMIIAFAAPFLGFFYYRLNHPAFFSVCYAPWALYCWVRVAHAATLRGVALWAAGLIVANLALMNSGTAKEAYMLLLTLNFSGACVLLSSARPWRERAAKLAALVWAGVIFVLLTTPVWATFLTTLKHAYTGYNAASAFQVQPGLLLGAFDEVFYRPIMAEERTFNPSVNFVILLGLLYFLATLRLSLGNRAVMALAVSSLPPLAMAFGLVSPHWIVSVPFLSNIAHLDNTFTCVLLVLWSVLAGVGFTQAAARLGTREGRGDLLIAGLLLFGLVFAWMGFRQAGHRAIFGAGLTFSPFPAGQTLPASSFVKGHLCVLLTACVALAWIVRGALVRRRLGPAGGILVVLCGLALLWRTGLHAGTVGFSNYVSRPTVRADFHARSAAVEFVRAAQRAEPARGFGFNSNFFPGWTGTYGLESIHGPDALVSPYVRELVGDLPGVTRIWDWRLYIEQQHAGTARPFLDALNVRYYFDLQSDQGLLGKALKLVKVADLDVYESPTAWPRAFFASQVEVYDQPAEFVRKIQTGDGRPFAAVQRDVFAAEPALAALPREFAGRTVVPATNYKLTENSTAFDLRASGPGVVVLTEAFWPGDFRAELNGRRTTVLRLNHAFKGVVVPAAGDYRVHFRYVPRKFPRNLMLCGIGAGLLAVSLFLALRPRAGRHA